VPASDTFSLAEPPRLDLPLYRFPFDAIAAASFAAVAVGIAGGAMEAFAEQNPHDTARAQLLARSRGLQQAARSLLVSTAASAWEEVVDTGRLREVSDARVHLAAVTATAQAVDAVETLAQVAGMSLLRDDDRFSRCWRDVHGLAQHAYLSRLRQDELRARLMGA
jgi:indole-3-acetate monooxygenase